MPECCWFNYRERRILPIMANWKGASHMPVIYLLIGTENERIARGAQGSLSPTPPKHEIPNGWQSNLCCCCIFKNLQERKVPQLPKQSIPLSNISSCPRVLSNENSYTSVNAIECCMGGGKVAATSHCWLTLILWFIRALDLFHMYCCQISYYLSCIRTPAYIFPCWNSFFFIWLIHIILCLLEY